MRWKSSLQMASPSAGGGSSPRASPRKKVKRENDADRMKHHPGYDKQERFYNASCGAKLFYDIYMPLTKRPDDAKDFLFIHGWSGSGAYYQLALDSLFERINGSKRPKTPIGTIVVVDLRGHGRNCKENKHSHLARLAVDIWELIQEEGLDHVVAIGSSLGGK